MTRAQSHVVGVAVLLAVTVVAMGTLTAAVGTVVESGAERADATRVADGFESVLGARAGRDRGTVAFTAGRLHSLDRELRLLDGDRVVATVPVDGLAWDGDGRGVTYLGGAVVQRSPAGASFARDPALVTGGDGTVVVGIRAVNGTVERAGRGGVEVDLRVRSDRVERRLGDGSWRVAVETATPRPWRDHLSSRAGTVTRRDLDGDGTPSVVAPLGNRTAVLVVHRQEVRTGG